MALGRMFSRLSAAVVTVLALAGLRSLGASGSAKEAAAKGYGHPLHRKYLRTQNVGKATGRNNCNPAVYPMTGTRAHAGNRCQHN